MKIEMTIDQERLTTIVDEWNVLNGEERIALLHTLMVDPDADLLHSFRVVFDRACKACNK